jgi:colanic acid/amylovoran biosynthesis glycosyltransferase
MRIAFLLNEFPKPSETFVVNQIIGLIERGHMVDIFTRYRKSDDPVDPQVKQYQLIDRTQYLDIPQAGRNVCWLPQRSS